MTVTFHTLSFRAANGRAFSGSVFWAKNSPAFYQGRIAPMESASMEGYPVFRTATATENSNEVRAQRAKIATVARRIKKAASAQALTLVSERKTEFCPR